MPERARGRFASGVERTVARIAGLLNRANVADARERAGSTLTEMIGAIGIARVSDGDAVAEALLATARRSVRHKLDVTATSD